MLPPPCPTDSDKEVDGFNPVKFLLPGYSGKTLSTKASHTLQRYLNLLISDVKSQLTRCRHLNRTLRQAIYEEFLAFAVSRALDLPELEDENSFWQYLNQENLTKEKHFQEFLDHYCYRVIVIYIFKVRFLASFYFESGHSCPKQAYLNPNSLIAKQFAKGTSSEIYARCLEPNVFSWFRPSEEHEPIIKNIVDIFLKLTLSEIIKIFSYNGASHPLDQSQYHLSHSLSHLHFGRFLNSLLIDFPLWVEGKEVPYDQNHEALGVLPEVVNCLYSGDHLESIAQSHWLAQEENSNLKWHQVICPDFQTSTFQTGNFFKICHEFQFLTSLVVLSKHQQFTPLQFLCYLTKEKKQREEGRENFTQPFLKFNDNKTDLPSYDRSVLNLINLPAKNPHHYVVSKIHEVEKSLKERGYLFVFTNQNLFVPSQKERTKQLLDVFKLEGHYSFENLKGKGEVPYHLYILTKRCLHVRESHFDGPPIPPDEINGLFHSRKQPSLSFQLAGEMNTFHDFSKFVAAQMDFFGEKSSVSKQVYCKKLTENLSFEFFQDAIFDGCFISSSNQKSNQITHPSYFSKLVETCLRFDQFFQLVSLESSYESKTQKPAMGFLGLPHNGLENYELVLIADFRNTEQIRLEIISRNSYKAVSEEYGHALCQYFGLLPKRRDININLFREYFQSQLGFQIIQHALTGSLTRLKSKLKNMLIPKFFIEAFPLPSKISEYLSFMKHPKDYYLGERDEVLLNDFANVRPQIESFCRKSPWAILSLVSQFKNTLSQASNYFESGRHNTINFDNPDLKAPLLKLKTYPIYPENPDVYCQFKTKKRSDFNLPITSFNYCFESETNSYSIKANHKDQVLVEFSTSKEMQLFLRFLFERFSNIPLVQLLKSLYIPRDQEIKDLVDHYFSKKEALNFLASECTSMIDQILKNEVTRTKSLS